MANLRDLESGYGTSKTRKNRRKQRDCMEWIFRCLLFLGEIAAQATGLYYSPSESALFSSKTPPQRSR